MAKIPSMVGLPPVDSDDSLQDLFLPSSRRETVNHQQGNDNYIWKGRHLMPAVPPEEYAQFARGNPYKESMYSQGSMDQPPRSSVASMFDPVPDLVNMPSLDDTLDESQMSPHLGDDPCEQEPLSEDLFAGLEDLLDLKPVPELQVSLVRPEDVASSCAASFASTAIPQTDQNDILTSPKLSENVKARGPTVPNRKKLFGDNGWLDSTKTKHSPIRKNSAIKGVKRRIKQQLADSTNKAGNGDEAQLVMVPGSAPKIGKITTPISLGPAAQSAIYSELEVLICETANKFLVQQYYDGRISQHSINAITTSWSAKGRPRVNEFRYDQTFQLKLVHINRHNLEFSGAASTNPIQLNAILRGWKVIAREMRIRTFCVPDSVIRKHLHDAEGLLTMLNASDSTIQDLHKLTDVAKSYMA